MVKKKRESDAPGEIDDRIALRWIVKDYYERSLPIVNELTDAWFEAEVCRRIGKPATTEGGLQYFYVKATEGGVADMFDGTPRVRLLDGGKPWLYEPSTAPDREEPCPGCGALHPLVMECRGAINRLFFMCDKDVPSKTHVIYARPDERESTIGNEWLNHHEPILPGKIGAWLRRIPRMVQTT